MWSLYLSPPQKWATIPSGNSGSRVRELKSPFWRFLLFRKNRNAYPTAWYFFQQATNFFKPKRLQKILATTATTKSSSSSNFVNLSISQDTKAHSKGKLLHACNNMKGQSICALFYSLETFPFRVSKSFEKKTMAWREVCHWGKRKEVTLTLMPKRGPRISDPMGSHPRYRYPMPSALSI